MDFMHVLRLCDSRVTHSTASTIGKLMQDIKRHVFSLSFTLQNSQSQREGFDNFPSSVQRIVPPLDSAETTAHHSSI